MVHVDHRHSQSRNRAAGVDQRFAEPLQAAGESLLEQVGDDPMGPPVLHLGDDLPRRRTIAEGPIRPLEGELPDSADHRPRETQILAHQQGDAA